MRGKTFVCDAVVTVAGDDGDDAAEFMGSE